MNDECLIPGKKIDLDNVTYFVHGMVHRAPLVSVSKKFKKSLSGLFENKDTICEDGFAQWIKNANSFNEAKFFEFGKVSLMSSLKYFTIVNYFRFFKLDKPLIAEEVQNMNSIEDFYPIREKLFRKYLSEPSGMNYLLERLEKGTLEEPKGQLPLRIRRYVYEAKKSIEHASERKINKLHIIVGCAHELPLEYLLSNPTLLENLKI